MPRRCQQAHCVKILIRWPTPKPTSSPTLCSAWEKWEMIPLRTGRGKLNGIRKTITSKDMNRIDGMPTEFEWKIFPGITTLGLLEKIQSLMTDLQCKPENFKDRISFMSMYNTTLHGKQKATKNNVNTIHRQLRNMRSLVFLGSWIRRRMVRNLFSQTRWIMGSNGRRNDGKFLSIRSSDISCLQCLWERRVTKHRRGKWVNTLQW